MLEDERNFLVDQLTRAALDARDADARRASAVAAADQSWQVKLSEQARAYRGLEEKLAVLQVANQRLTVQVRINAVPNEAYAAIFPHTSLSTYTGELNRRPQCGRVSRHR